MNTITARFEGGRLMYAVRSIKLSGAMLLEGDESGYQMVYVYLSKNEAHRKLYFLEFEAKMPN